MPEYTLDPNQVDFDLTFDQYADLAAETAAYPNSNEAQRITYTAIGLSGEVGEVANQIKKYMRDDDYRLTAERKAKLSAELGDVLWYWFELCRSLGLDPVSVAYKNLLKLSARKASNTIKGEGDER